MYTLSISIDGKTEEAQMKQKQVPKEGHEEMLEINGRPMRIKFGEVNQIGESNYTTTAVLIA